MNKENEVLYKTDRILIAFFNTVFFNKNANLFEDDYLEISNDNIRAVEKIENNCEYIYKDIFTGITYKNNKTNINKDGEEIVNKTRKITDFKKAKSLSKRKIERLIKDLQSSKRKFNDAMQNNNFYNQYPEQNYEANDINPLVNKPKCKIYRLPIKNRKQKKD